MLARPQQPAQRREPVRACLARQQVLAEPVWRLPCAWQLAAVKTAWRLAALTRKPAWLLPEVLRREVLRRLAPALAAPPAG